MPPSAPQLLIAPALAGLTPFVSYPLALGSGRSVDALVNLRLSWAAANGGRAPG